MALFGLRRAVGVGPGSRIGELLLHLAQLRFGPLDSLLQLRRLLRRLLGGGGGAVLAAPAAAVGGGGLRRGGGRRLALVAPALVLGPAAVVAGQLAVLADDRAAADRLQ